MKVHKAFNKLINNELVFVTDPDFYQKFPTAKLTDPGSMTRMLMAESGLGDTTVRKYRSTFKNQVLTYFILALKRKTTVRHNKAYES